MLTLARLTAFAIFLWLLRCKDVLPRLWILPMLVRKSVRRWTFIGLESGEMPRRMKGSWVRAAEVGGPRG